MCRWHLLPISQFSKKLLRIKLCNTSQPIFFFHQENCNICPRHIYYCLMNTKLSQPEMPDFLAKNVSSSTVFFLDATSTPDNEKAVVCGGREHCSSNYEMDRPEFEHYCVEFVSSGEGTLTLGRRRQTWLTAGSVFTYGPGIPHRIVANPANPPVKYFVDIAGAGCLQLMQEFDLLPGTLCHVSSVQAVQAAFDSLIRHGQDRSHWRQRACDCLFESLMIEIARSAIPHGSRQSQAFATYRRCRDLIREQFLSLSSLKEIAAETHADAAYLCRLFKRFGESSPYEYLTQLRMEYAAELLHNSNALIKEVAAELGFANPFHFSRVFKRVHAMSPEHFARIAQRK